MTKTAKKSIRQKPIEIDGNVVFELREYLLMMSQREFGALLGVGKLTVLRWELGQTKPGAEHRNKIRSLRQAALDAEPIAMPEVFTPAAQAAFLAATERSIYKAVEAWRQAEAA